MNDDLCFLSAAALRQRISRKEVSPVDVTKAVLARAERLQPELNCFITLSSEQAAAQARESERRIMAGEPLRLLEGITETTSPTMTLCPWRGYARRVAS
jgi:aspartyl-tRNA(Asn)/glutamyl-tRNA(Gln) amidotransferase subunit A